MDVGFVLDDLGGKFQLCAIQFTQWCVRLLLLGIVLMNLIVLAILMLTRRCLVARWGPTDDHFLHPSQYA